MKFMHWLAQEMLLRDAFDEKGELPRGGDFLTPRFDKPSMGYYWAMSW